MSALDPEMVALLEEAHILTLATASGGQPYCASCFYHYEVESGLLIFVSDPGTRHAREFSENPEVAAAIHCNPRDVAAIRGLQILGRVRALGDETATPERSREHYLERFPEARGFDRGSGIHFWTLRPSFIKLTDNRIAFGAKRIWEAD